jgi:spore coat protein H
MRKYFIFIVALIIVGCSSCREEGLLDELTGEKIDTANYSDWSETTHGNMVSPDYSTVFNQNEVLRFDIKISSDDWASMQADLAANLNFSPAGPGGNLGGGPGGSPTFSDFDPIWVSCDFKFSDKEWYHVGIRYKGNSSLQSAYQSGNKKLSFKLDFDEFESDYPTMNDQRFFGFRQLNLNNNFNDVSLMREKVGADLFRQFGLASAQSAFCVLYIDNGTGPQYYGVYTLVEEVDDTVLDTQFAVGTGNLYKPDGDAASFAYGTYDKSEMELKTNLETADYSDVKALFDAVNGSERTSDVEAWKAKLETIFNVDVFLKWLAANTVIQNWDTYGIMTHNYYLYNNPENGLLTWIPWDNNEAFQTGKQGGALSLALSEVGGNWPLIRYIINIDEYMQVYKTYLKQFIEEVFVPTNMISTYSKFYDLLKEYAYAEETGFTFIRSDSEFDQGVSTLKSHVQTRNNAVINFLK